MFNVLSKIENIIFLFSLLIIIVLNIYGSIFMLASYWPCLDKNMFIPFVISLLLMITLIYFYNKFNISKNKAIVISLIVTLTSISFRLYLNKSFNVYPTSDQWQMLSGLNTLINENDFSPLDKYRYFGIYPHIALLYFPLYLPIKLFKYNALPYYNLNAFAIQISFILLSLSIKNIKGLKEGFFTYLFLNLFIPSYFLNFVIYGDVISLFFISLALLILSINFNDFLKLILSSFCIGTSYLGRTNSIVWIIALVIVLILYTKKPLNTTLAIGISTICFISPKLFTESFLNNKANNNIYNYSLPTSSWIYTGTGYSIPGDAGIYNPFGLDTFFDNDCDHNKTDSIVKEAIKDNLYNLSNPKSMTLFLKRKNENTWCDPDFESMGFVMPNSGYVVEQFVEEGYRIPVGTAQEDATYTNKLGDFVYSNFMTIRLLEKIYLFIVLLIPFLTSIFRIKNNEYTKYSLFYQLNFVGFFLLQLFIETKPRYVLISFILMIVLAVYELPYLTNEFHKQYKNHCHIKE